RILQCILSSLRPHLLILFFFHATSTTQLYTLSLHDALPIYLRRFVADPRGKFTATIDFLTGRRHVITICDHWLALDRRNSGPIRSEEHTSELQSRGHLVCRLLLEKKKNNIILFS